MRFTEFLRTSVLLFAVLLLVTGGLHFDGLLDTCDGVFSQRTPERRLEVMRDSRSGAFAIAAGALVVMLWWAWRGTITPDYYNPVEVSGLYWHFVDIVWIFLFPLLYLIGRHAQ